MVKTLLFPGLRGPAVPDTGVCQKETLLHLKLHVGKSAFKATNQGLEGRFFCRDSREKVDTKGVFFSEHTGQTVVGQVGRGEKDGQETSCGIVPISPSPGK